MSKHRVRHNKTCQNCGHFVEKRFCPGCGQENSDSRHSFHHLFTHFISDFLHYDSSFWKTTKTLFTKPGKASLDYMNGKRKSYVNPFSYYILASFLTFFIPSILPYPNDNKEANTKIQIENNTLVKDSILPQVQYNSRRVQIDSIQKAEVKKFDKTWDTLESAFKNMNLKDRQEKAADFFKHNLSKTFFVYMPIFAFWMWLFHNRKKRYYFDSGIFTLHFFSVLLLSITSVILLDCALSWLHLSVFRVFLWMALSAYITFYYFRANRNFYQENRLKSNIKAAILMMIHTFFILIVFLGYAAYTVYKVFL